MNKNEFFELNERIYFYAFVPFMLLFALAIAVTK